MHPDHSPFARFTSRSRLDKSVNSLVGLVEGIVADGQIEEAELDFLRLWLGEHAELRDSHPFNELVPKVEAAVADGVLDEEERQDIVWLCDRLRSTEYFDSVTAGIQRLHAMLGGILADGRISEAELRGLAAWQREHQYLRTCWPFDEVQSLIASVLQDKVIDEEEQKALSDFCSQFVAVLDQRTVRNPVVAEGGTLKGLCAVSPTIEFVGSKFCFTGASTRYTRKTLSETVKRLGGEFASSMSAGVNYLVIGGEGNPAWAFACYGRKVEEAVRLRKEGSRLLIVHEYDFHDAVADRE
jgi:NAD-dependent DNA ligase